MILGCGEMSGDVFLWFGSAKYLRGTSSNSTHFQYDRKQFSGADWNWAGFTNPTHEWKPAEPWPSLPFSDYCSCQTRFLISAESFVCCHTHGNNRMCGILNGKWSVYWRALVVSDLPGNVFHLRAHCIEHIPSSKGYHWRLWSIHFFLDVDYQRGKVSKCLLNSQEVDVRMNERAVDTKWQGISVKSLKFKKKFKLTLTLFFQAEAAHTCAQTRILRPTSRNTVSFLTVRNSQPNETKAKRKMRKAWAETPDVSRI